MIRTLAAAALAVAALTPAAHAATSASCPWGPQIGTACIRDPQDLVLDTGCPILEGQTVLGIRCAPHATTRSGATTPDLRHAVCVLVRDNTGINMACEG